MAQQVLGQFFDFFGDEKSAHCTAFRYRSCGWLSGGGNDRFEHGDEVKSSSLSLAAPAYSDLFFDDSVF